MYDIQYCFICRPSDSTVSDNAEIETQDSLRLRHWLSNALTTRLDFIHKEIKFTNNWNAWLESGSRKATNNFFFKVLKYWMISLEDWRLSLQLESKKGWKTSIGKLLRSVLRIQDVYPGSQILMFIHPWSRLSDPTIATKEFVWFPTCFCSLKSQILQNCKLFYFRSGKDKNLSQFTKNYKLFTHKIFTKLPNIWNWDPGSGKNQFRIQGSKRQRIPYPDPQHWLGKYITSLQAPRPQAFTPATRNL